MLKGIYRFFSVALAVLILASSIGISKSTHTCLMAVVKECKDDDACCKKPEPVKSCCEKKPLKRHHSKSDKNDNCCRDVVKVYSQPPVFFTNGINFKPKPVFCADVNFAAFNTDFVVRLHTFSETFDSFHGPPFSGRIVLSKISQLRI